MAGREKVGSLGKTINLSPTICGSRKMLPDFYLELSERRSLVVSTSDGKARKSSTLEPISFLLFSWKNLWDGFLFSSECLKDIHTTAVFKVLWPRGMHTGVMGPEEIVLVWGFLLEGRWYGNDRKSVIRVQPASGKGAVRASWCGGHWCSHVCLTRKSQGNCQVGNCLTEGLMITLQKHKSDFPLYCNSPFPHPSSGEARSNSSYG